MRNEPYLLDLALRDFSWSGESEARFRWLKDEGKAKKQNLYVDNCFKYFGYEGEERD